MTAGDAQAMAKEGHRGPGHEAARKARHAVEAVLLTLVDMPPSVDRAGLRDRLLRACEFLYASIDLPDIAVAHLQGLGEAAAVARECRAMLLSARDAAGPGPIGQAAARLAEVEAALARAYEEVARIQFDRRSELITGALAPVVVGARPFRASRGAPQLHAFTRARLVPHVLVGSGEAPAPPGPKATVRRPETMEDLLAFGEAAASGELQKSLLAEPEPEPAEDAPPPPFVFEPAASEVEVLRRIARDCLEDIAIHRTLRTPNAIETWLDQGPFEQRLLDNLDAFAALGGAALPMVPLFVAEADAPDPERTFAAAMTLGSIEGSDSLAAAVMMFKQSAPETYPGWYDGLRLAPSPAIDAAMAELAGSPRPAWVAFALDVLLARGTVPDAVVRPLLASTDPAVMERVARALAVSLPAADAEGALSNMCAAAPSDSVFLIAAESLLQRGHGSVLRALREVAAGRSSGAGSAAEGARAPSPARVEGALELLCLAGTGADLDLLLAGLRAAGEAGRPRARLARALGRFGHAGAIPALLDLLREDEVGEEDALAAAEALDRITGAGLREIVEEPWEVDLPPEAEGHGIPVPTRKVEKMVVEPAPWTDWLQENGDRLDRKVKLRGGVPFVLLAIVDELAARVTPPARRAEAARELAIVAGPSMRLVTDDWVARQQRALVDLRERVLDLGVSPGLWTFAADRWAKGGAPRSVPPPPPAGSAPAARVPAHAPAPEPAAGLAGATAPAASHAPAPSAAPVQRVLPSFMRAAAAEAPSVAAPGAGEPATPDVNTPVRGAPPAPAAVQAPPPAAAADPHSPHPTPAGKKDTRSGSTMLGLVLPMMPAMPFQPSAPAAQGAAASPGAPSAAATQGAPRAAGEAGADETIDATPDEDEPGTLIGASSIPPDRALPFHRPEPPGDARASAELTLEQYASMCAELAVFPERAEAVFAKHGLADPRRRADVDAAWKARLSRYPSERAEWERRYWQHESSWRRSAGK